MTDVSLNSTAFVVEIATTDILLEIGQRAVTEGGGGGGVTDHGALTGLADDDHTQYFNTTRGDVRYSLIGHNHDSSYAALSHTHTASQITDFSTAADARITLQKGAALGLAPLGADSKIDASYLPSYVDDVLEYANFAAFPATGSTGIIYVALDTNKTYRWSGSAYTQIAAGDVNTVFGRSGVITAQNGDYNSGQITESGNLFFTGARAIASLLTGFAAGAGTVSATDSILAAIQKIVGNIAALSFLVPANNLSDVASAATARNNLGVAKHAIPFGADTPADGTTYATTYAPFAGTITDLKGVRTASGTITVAVYINGVAVTGLGAVAVTSTPQNLTATAANTFALGDEITIVRSANSSAAGLRGTILYTK